MLLPESFSRECPLPEPLSADSSRRAVAEGAAILHLWASPGLLRSPHEVAWLFSPVTGNRHWPGDLWGLDSKGDLLIVEAKTCVQGKRCDPFEDFVSAGRAIAKGTSPNIRSSRLHDHWAKLHEAERVFISKHLRDLEVRRPLLGCYPGIVPYGSHRAHVKRWREVYLHQIRKTISDSAYPRQVETYLSTREQRRNPKPHLLGLGAEVEDGRLVLSREGRAHFEALRSLVGENHVHMLTVTIELGPRCAKAQRGDPS